MVKAGGLLWLFVRLVRLVGRGEQWFGHSPDGASGPPNDHTTSWDMPFIAHDRLHRGISGATDRGVQARQELCGGEIVGLGGRVRGEIVRPDRA